MLNKANVVYDILGKIDALSEFPQSKSIILIKSNGEILYTNVEQQNIYNVEVGANLFDLDTEPQLSSLISNISKSDLSFFSCDLIVKSRESFCEGFLLTIEKIKLNLEPVFIIYIDSQDNKNAVTKKVNTFNQALESVNVGVLIANSNAKIQYTSKAFEKLFNSHIEELFNQHISFPFIQYLSKSEINELNRVINSKKKWKKVITQIDNQGEVSYIEVKLYITSDSFLNLLNYIVTATDITNFVKQARLLKKSEQRQKTIINNISDPILILKRVNGELLMENANNNFYYDILGRAIKPKEIHFELLNPVLHSIIHEAIVNLERKNKKHSPFHYTVPKSNRRYLGKVTFTDDNYDNTRLYIINMTDITEQLEIERKLRDAYKKEISLNKLKSKFLANMSHEIRTPLNAIVGYSDLLEDDVKAMNYESSSKMAEFLKEGVNRLVKLVDNIVEVSLLESGNEELTVEILDINTLLQNQFDIWKNEIKAKNISLNYNLSPRKLIVEANSDKLEKAFNEIVENAIKYNVNGGSIYVNTLEKNGNVIIEFVDTGIGIEQNNLDRIFELFEQEEDVGYTRSYEGAGLGLSLSQKLITFMKGKLNIFSQPGQGTTITVSFPISKNNSN